MWIVMTQSYAGPAGVFPKGMRADLPEAVLDQLVRKTKKGKVVTLWEKSVAPWDEHTDPKAIALAEARQSYEATRTKARDLFAQAEALDAEAGALSAAVKEADAAADQAEQDATNARKAAAKKGAGDKAEYLAADLTREHARAAARYDIVLSESRILYARATLKRLEAEDAERKAKQLAEQLGIKEAEPAETGPTPEDDDQSEGQAVPPGDEPGPVPNEVEAKAD